MKSCTDFIVGCEPNGSNLSWTLRKTKSVKFVVANVESYKISLEAHQRYSYLELPSDAL